MTNAEMIKEIRKPGRVLMPVMMPNDVIYIEVKKADLIWNLKNAAQSDTCPWIIYSQSDSEMILDTAE